MFLMKNKQRGQRHICRQQGHCLSLTNVSPILTTLLTSPSPSLTSLCLLLQINSKNLGLILISSYIAAIITPPSSLQTLQSVSVYSGILPSDLVGIRNITIPPWPARFKYPFRFTCRPMSKSFITEILSFPGLDLLCFIRC